MAKAKPMWHAKLVIFLVDDRHRAESIVDIDQAGYVSYEECMYSMMAEVNRYCTGRWNAAATVDEFLRERHSISVALTIERKDVPNV